MGTLALDVLDAELVCGGLASGGCCLVAAFVAVLLLLAAR